MTSKEGYSLPQVSVVITNHNYGRYLVKTISSVLAQRDVNVEVVIVDNGSTDNSRQIIGEFGSRISSVFQEDVGQSRGRNAGIANTKFELISFLDADDYWEPNKLASEIRLINAESEFVYCGIRQFNDSDGTTFRVVAPRFVGDCREAFVEYPNLAIVPAGESCSLITRSLLEKVGLFDVSLNGAAGRDFFRRCSGVTQFAAAPEALVHYRLHDSNFSKNVKAVMDDTELSYERLFSDPAWTSFLSKKGECLRKLQWSFFKTNVKRLTFGEAFINMKKIIQTF